MNKLILKERETRENIVSIINQSDLPAFILKAIVKDLYEQLQTIEQQQYNLAKEKEEKEINKIKEENNE